MEIPARDYAKVGVDRVVDGWDDLKLEIPRGDGEKNLGEAIHGWILWPKCYIRIAQPNPPDLGIISSRLKGNIIYAIFQGTLSTTRQGS